MIAGDNDTWEGVSIELWRRVAEKLNIRYEFVQLNEFTAEESLVQGNVDVLALANANPNTNNTLNLSQIYYTDHLGMAVPQTQTISSITKAFFSPRFWQIVAILSIMLLVVGGLIYFIERSANDEGFGGKRSVWQGIGSGFWWAGVTLTTIGYGDKAPVTFWGRTIAMFWMLVSMAVTAVFTATLVSIMGQPGSNSVSFPGDLRKMNIGAITNTPAASYLQEERVKYKEYTNLGEALSDAQTNNIDGVVAGVSAMRYQITENNNLTLRIETKQVLPHFYAFGFQKNSHLYQPINQALLEIITTKSWQQELNRYIPEP
jgi:ABC-type amino acid transport substrate-binding protein